MITLKLQIPLKVVGVFFKVSAAVHLISPWILINRWNLLMPQPWSHSQVEMHTLLHLQSPHTNQIKPNEDAQEKRMRQAYKGWKNEKTNMKNPAEWSEIFFGLRMYLGDGKRHWLIPLILSLNDLKLLLPAVYKCVFSLVNCKSPSQPHMSHWPPLPHICSEPKPYRLFVWYVCIMSSLMKLHCSLSYQYLYITIRDYLRIRVLI